jgi:hypothetical protein
MSAVFLFSKKRKAAKTFLNLPAFYFIGLLPKRQTEVFLLEKVSSVRNTFLNTSFEKTKKEYEIRLDLASGALAARKLHAK